MAADSNDFHLSIISPASKGMELGEPEPGSCWALCPGGGQPPCPAVPASLPLPMDARNEHPASSVSQTEVF